MLQQGDITVKDLILQFKSWIMYLLGKWKVILVFGLIGAVIGFALTYKKKPLYTATLNFAMEDEKSGGGIGGALGLASQLGFDFGGGSAGGAFTSANLTELMRSRNVVEKTLLDTVRVNGKTVTLIAFYIDFMGLDKDGKDAEMANARFVPGARRSSFSLTQNAILGSIYGRLLKYNLKVYQADRKVSILTIEVKSENELFSKLFAETLASQVSQFYVETKTKKSAQNLAILQRQADSIRAELNSAILGSAAANDNVYNLNPALNVKRVPGTTRQIDVQANTAILTEIVKNLELAKITLRKETPLLQIIDVPILPLAEERKSKAKAMIIGAIVAGMIGVVVLTAGRIWRAIMK